MNPRFRNVGGEPNAPVSSWPLEALRSALERGDLQTYRHMVGEIKRAPWGRTARRIQEVLTWAQPYGAAKLMSRAIEHARAASRRRESEWVAEQLREAVRASGLSRSEFARELGTSPSRLSTYLNGSVTPAATLLARAKSIAGSALENPSQR